MLTEETHTHFHPYNTPCHDTAFSRAVRSPNAARLITKQPAQCALWDLLPPRGWVWNFNSEYPPQSFISGLLLFHNRGQIATVCHNNRNSTSSHHTVSQAPSQNQNHFKWTDSNSKVTRVTEKPHIWNCFLDVYHENKSHSLQRRRYPPVFTYFLLLPALYWFWTPPLSVSEVFALRLFTPLSRSSSPSGIFLSFAQWALDLGGLRALFPS